MTDSHEADDDDDALAEALADQLVKLARRPGVLRLAALQMAGLIPPAGEITQNQLASALGVSRSRVQQIAARANAKLKIRLRPYLQP